MQMKNRPTSALVPFTIPVVKLPICSAAGHKVFMRQPRNRGTMMMPPGTLSSHFLMGTCIGFPPLLLLRFRLFLLACLPKKCVSNRSGNAHPVRFVRPSFLLYFLNFSGLPSAFHASTIQPTSRFVKFVFLKIESNFFMTIPPFFPAFCAFLPRKPRLKSSI